MRAQLMVVGLIITVVMIGSSCFAAGLVINEVSLVHKMKPFEVSY